MNSIYCLFLSLCLSFIGYNQEPQPVEDTNGFIYEYPLYEPSCSLYFPGGRDSLTAYLQREFIITDEMILKANGQKLYMRTTIDPSGKVIAAKATKEIPDCPECTQEAIRVLLSMPKWNPNLQNGKAVNGFYNIPFRFPQVKKDGGK